MIPSCVAKAILTDDAEGLEDALAQLEPQAHQRLQHCRTVSVQLSPEAAQGLGWYLPRVENTLRQHQLLEPGSRDVLDRWHEIAGLQQRFASSRMPPIEVPAESVFRLLVTIPLTMNAHGGICSIAVRRNLAAFAESCIDQLQLKVPPQAFWPRGASRWQRVCHLCDVAVTSLTLLALLGFLVYAARWPDTPALDVLSLGSF